MISLFHDSDQQAILQKRSHEDLHSTALFSDTTSKVIVLAIDGSNSSSDRRVKNSSTGRRMRDLSSSSVVDS